MEIRGDRRAPRSLVAVAGAMTCGFLGSGLARRDFPALDGFAVVHGAHHRYFVLLPILAAPAVTTAALLRVKFGRRFRRHHVRRGYGRHGRPCGNDLVDRVLGALGRVDVWILVISFLTLIVNVAGVIFEYLTLVKPD